RIEPDAASSIRLGIGRFETAGDRRQLRLCLIDRDAALQTNEPFDPPGAAILQLVCTAIELRLHRCRNPELKSVTDEGAVKPVGGDTDDRMGQTREHLRLADDTRVAMKPVLPHLVADNRDWMRIAAHVLTGFEAAPEYGMDTDCVEIVGRHHAAGDALCAIAEGQRRSGDLLADERISERAAALEILEVRPRDVVSARSAVCAGERD